MPMQTADGRYQIVYNGEVYNSPELRKELESEGTSFRTTSDTEVLLHLFARDGAAMLPRLNGMFAIAVWDAEERSLFLCRDRLGIKPLYYHWDGKTLRFASEPKALFATGLNPAFSESAWAELLCFRFIAGEATPYEGVRRLLPGHSLTLKRGCLATTRWWSIAGRAEELRQAPLADPVGWYREIFDDSVGLRRLSDVPIGVLLSGGLDSSSVAAALANQAGEGVATFTVRFGRVGYDEGPVAAEVVRRYGLEGHEICLDESELFSRLLHASWLNDAPLAHGNEPHIFAISEYAKPHVTVLLSGEGSDETLGGYVRYRPLQFPITDPIRRVVASTGTSPSKLATGRLRKFLRMLELPFDDAMVLYNACDVLPDDLRELGMDGEVRFAYREEVVRRARTLYPDEPARRAMFSDQHTFLCSLLDRNDRMTMGASIECRVPFLDHRIVERLAAMPTAQLLSRRRNKHLLRRSLGHRLPEAVLRHRKWGFGIPWESHFREVDQLKDFVAALPDARPIDSGPLDRTAVRRVVQEFLRGDTRWGLLVRQLVMIAAWHQACVAQGSGFGRQVEPRRPPHVRTQRSLSRLG
jgi:asparagine synthase (glutamine-hydrolysing)